MNFQDIIKNIDYSEIKITKFLNSEEQAQIKNAFKGANYSLEGGYSNPEYKRFLLNTEEALITCFKITYNDSFLTLSHANILGTLLSLGIERNTIGDILPDQAVFFCISEIKDYLLQEFTKISHSPITLKEIDGTYIKRVINLEEHKTFIDSMRLDLVVSRIAQVSRDKAKFMIENDLIKLNHQITTKATKLVEENDIISIRKHGRFQVINTQKRSKKNKIVLIYGKFI